MAAPALPSSLRLLLGFVTSLLVTGFLVAGFAGPANAADGYRYWNYFHLSGDTWKFSQVGPSGYQPKDGDVEAYRFGTSTTDKGLPPRAELSKVNFDTVCSGEKAAAGEKRVAVILDFGTDADAETTPPAPRADCAVVAADANGQQVLDTVADVRSEKGLTCALDGYPVQGCGEPIANAPAPAKEKPVAFELPASSGAGAGQATSSGSEGSSDSDLVWPLVGASAVVLVIGVGGFALSRRHKAA